MMDHFLQDYEEQNPDLAVFFNEALDNESNNEPHCLSLIKELENAAFRYEIGEQIGQGGMKSIYRAIDTLTQREVALAIIQKELQSKQDLRAFIQEAWLTANLEHPNIVPIHDVGITPEGNPFFTLKLLRGENLSTILKKLKCSDPKYMEAYPQTRLLEIFKRVCEAVSFAHDRGVIHLDLKPANIQVCDYGEVQVMDWGISKLTQEFFFPEEVQAPDCPGS